MANRHLFRSIVLQTLFEWDMRDFTNMDFNQTIRYNLDSFSDTGSTDTADILLLVENIAKKRILIDEIILKAAPEWPLEKITLIDRNILRIGMYELLFGDRSLVPPKVALNEAIELAKSFGGPKSSRFVNGVIGAVYRELGEPGKDERVNVSLDAVPYEQMPIDQKGAAVVYSVDVRNVLRIGMVHDIFGYWTLAKGGIEENETPEQGTIREVKEETDWDVELVQKLGDNEYIAHHPQRGPVRKQVQYFLAKSDHTKPTLEKNSGGLNDVRWFELNELADLNIYNDVSKMLIKSIEILKPSPIIDDETIDDESTTETEIPVSESTIEPNLENIKNNDKSTDKKNVENSGFSIDQLSAMKLIELKALAKARGLKEYSSLKKEDLVSLLVV